MAPVMAASAISCALRPLLGAIEKSATDGERCCPGVISGQQGSAARRPSGLRAACPGKAGGDDLTKMEEESGVTHRRSAPGVLTPEVSSPAALAKARALKAPANLTSSEWCGLTSYARPSRGGDNQIRSQQPNTPPTLPTPPTTTTATASWLSEARTLLRHHCRRTSESSDQLAQSSTETAATSCAGRASGRAATI